MMKNIILRKYNQDLSSVSDNGRYVYFYTDQAHKQSYVKIGKTWHPQKNLPTLTRGTYSTGRYGLILDVHKVPLTPNYKYDDVALQYEQYLHKKYRSYRIDSTEFFDINLQIISELLWEECERGFVKVAYCDPTWIEELIDITGVENRRLIEAVLWCMGKLTEYGYMFPDVPIEILDDNTIMGGVRPTSRRTVVDIICASVYENIKFTKKMED